MTQTAQIQSTTPITDTMAAYRSQRHGLRTSSRHWMESHRKLEAALQQIAAAHPDFDAQAVAREALRA